MRRRLIISDYNRNAYQQVMKRAHPGHHQPLVLMGPPGLGKSLLLDALQHRVTGAIRMTAEEWMSNVIRGSKDPRKPTVGWFKRAEHVFLDNAEVLADRPRTQECLAESIVKSGRSVIIVSNSTLTSLNALLQTLLPASPEILRMSRPTAPELRRIACLLLRDDCDGATPPRTDSAGNPGEVLGLIAQSAARRTLVGVR